MHDKQVLVMYHPNKRGLGQDTHPRTFFPEVFILFMLFNKSACCFDLKLAGRDVLYRWNDRPSAPSQKKCN